MRTLVPRKFTLIDAMVLIAATGIALVPVRIFFWESLRFPDEWSAREILDTSLNLHVMLAPFAICLGCSLWLLRIKSPRPRLRRTFRQPGMAATTAALVHLLLSWIGLLIFVYVNRVSLNSLFELSLWIRIGMLPTALLGATVSAVWAVLWLSGAWRSEPSWIDRAGRALGTYWVMTSVFGGWMYYAG
jgi:hypothetical protein